MNLSRPFIERPVATTLLTAGIALAGALAYLHLPVSPLPQVDYPTISVSASLPGADPETVSTSVAEPLERYLGEIADVTEITSQSSTGGTRITLQFDLDRDINGAARDVQAAINAAAADVSTSLSSNPTYRKVNPADAPLMILALTSRTLTRGQLYDAASNVLQQRLSQLDGIGQVSIGGATLPAVRVELNPTAMFRYGIGLEDVRAALASANANSPKGAIEEGGRRFQLYTNDQASHASEYRPLVIAYRNGSAVRLSDVADVEDSVQDLRNEGRANGEPAVLVILSRQPGANIIDTVDQVKAELPQLEASLPSDVNLSIVSDRSATIRASLRDTKWTLLLAVALVTFVVFLTLGDVRAALVPAVVVPISLIGTFSGMYLLGFSLDNLSLMALTIATGFVVDDAIVVLENISRHVENGMPRREAALRGAREVGFTVVSISVSLVAVFIPILLMGGIIGRLFREFTATLSLAIAISMVISLTTTPMMCALMLRPPARAAGRAPRRSFMSRSLVWYERTLAWSLEHGRLVMFALAVTVALNVLLFTVIPKGFFPQEDTGLITGGIVADQSISFQLMKDKLVQLMGIVQADPAVQSIAGFTGAGSGGGASQANFGYVYVLLKPLSVRKISSDEVVARLRDKLAQVPGARLFLQTVQDIRVGGRQANAEYQFTLQADKISDLYEWGPKLVAALEQSPVVADVNSDQQQKGLQTDVSYDRATAARLGVTVSELDATLYDAFGQRQVSTIFNALNQYHVIMEVAPRYWQSPQSLSDIYVSTSGGAATGTQNTNLSTVGGGTTSSTAVGGSGSGGAVPAAGSGASGTAVGGIGSGVGGSAAAASNSVQNALTNAIANTGRGAVSSGAAVSAKVETMVPLAAVSSHAAGTTRLSVNHHGLFASTTISFNLEPGMSLSDATQAVTRAMEEIHMPTSVHGIFAGTAATFQQSLVSELVLIAAALLAVYIVLGVLYESYVHPITIISTLPSAGVGAVLALMVSHTEFSIIAMIGVILLIGIVKKNAIMMIDFAIHAERTLGLAPREAIYQACLLRFRPIMMTTLAALLGAVPLAASYGNGAELRRPLGISIVGGLIMSQMLTLYTTPVLYVYLDRFQTWLKARWPRRWSDAEAAQVSP
ncbi:MAG TPA: efflux RND transporter permease subunit [Steroidobacteraceae bacterium]|nr:efflux RND transporter permease subunit [Steroidobacteraceae bacterium]